MTEKNKKTVLVIGGDAAGMSFASKVKREQPDWDVRVLERGEHTSYSACGIPYFVSGRVDKLDKLKIVTPEQFREKRGIEVHIGWEAISINRNENTVCANNVRDGGKKEFSYDILMIATGADATKPPIGGLDLDGVFTVRNLVDAGKIHSFISEEKPAKGIIIGGGYIGLEMAEALRERELGAEIVEMLPQVLNPMDEAITDVVMEELKRHNVPVHLDSKVTNIIGKDGKVSAVEIQGFEEPVSAEMVILGSGIRPNSQIAKDAGLKVGDLGGILVNDRMQTNDPDIYAGGDCVEQYHIVTGKSAFVPLGPAANKHGRTAAINVTGGNAEFPGIVGTAVMKVFDLTISRTGITEKEARENGLPHFGQTIETRERAGYYKPAGKLTIHVVANKLSGQLLGAQIVGGETAAKRIDPFAVALHNKMTLDEVAMLDLSYAPPYSPVIDPVGVAAQVAASKREKP